MVKFLNIKNIKPAPEPFYLLDKFSGTLSIEEYRQLLENDKIILTINKPLVNVLPEISEDNDDFLINSKNYVKKYEIKIIILFLCVVYMKEKY